MKGIGQFFLGVITAAGSSLLVLAAASLAIVEGQINISFVPSPTLPVAAATIALDSTVLATQPIIPTTPLISTTATEPALCHYPPTWGEYTVLPGDSLESLAAEVGISAEEIYNNNCLDSTFLIAGMLLHLPNPAPTSTVPPALPTAAPPLLTAAPPPPTSVRCGPYPGWITYIVRPGDNLFRLGLAFRVNVATLKFANCLSSDYIYAGQRLFVPNVPTLTPRITQTVVPSPTVSPTATQTPPTPGSTTPVADTLVPPTVTLSVTPTQVPSATATLTVTPTEVPTQTLTHTQTLTPTPTTGESGSTTDEPTITVTEENVP